MIRNPPTMKAAPTVKDIRRQIDNLGRVTIPADVRLALGVTPGQEISFSMGDGYALVSPTVVKCVGCGAPEPKRSSRLERGVLCSSCTRGSARKLGLEISGRVA